MDAEATLIAALKAKQRVLGLPDREMASRLSVSRSLWTKVRLGQYRLRRSARIQQGVARGFPELSGALLQFLMSTDAARDSHQRVLPQEAPQPTQAEQQAAPEAPVAL